MIKDLPIYVNLFFIATTVLTIFFWARATESRSTILLFSVLWLVIQGFLGFTGFYLNTNSIPPRFPLLILPAVILITTLFILKKGKQFIDRHDPKWLTLLHTVRVPVELVLLWLFLNKQVPELMTFEGRNFDILSGLTAPLVAYLGYTKKRLNKVSLLIWNFLCSGLLLNIVVNAIFSAPSSFQQFAFDQPNVGVLYFPFVWLPSFIVPLVLFAHLVCIRQLLNNEPSKSING